MSEPWMYPEGKSDCCEADVYNGICHACGEHCGLIEDEDESPYGPTNANTNTEVHNGR